MLGRNIERGEIVEVVLDIGAERDREAHRSEDFGDLLDHLGDRMQGALRIRRGGQGDVHPLSGEPGFQRCGL